VGSHLIQSLLSKGKKVRALYRQAVPIFAGSEQCEWIQGDILDPIGLTDALAGVDYVYHCAAIVSFAPGAATKMLQSNVEGTANVVNACLVQKIKKLIFVSSVGVYSPAEKFVESDVWKTLPSEHDWFPSWSKRIGEILLESYKVQYNYDNWSIIRPANIFGDYDDFSGGGTVISSTIKKIYEANENDTIECWGDGSPIRDFVYGADVADAIFKLYTNNIKDVVNFGSGEEITIKSMVENLVEISGKNLKIQWDPSKPNGDMRRQMDVTKQKEYNLLPETSFKRALNRTYYYYASRFPNPNLKIYTKDLLDKGYYIGDLDEIIDDLGEVYGNLDESDKERISEIHKNNFVE
jgi:GDP-L-fucose synthase